MADESPYPYPTQPTQLEQLAGVAQQASPPPAPSSSSSIAAIAIYDNHGGLGHQRPPNPRKRKHEGYPPRGVDALTPEQLAKKRANDREAQRAIRERTKDTITTLEARIKQLETQEPYQDMQSIMKARDDALAENVELKKTIRNIMKLAQTGLSIDQENTCNAPQATTARQLSGQDFTQSQDREGAPNAVMYPTQNGENQPYLHPDLRSLETLPSTKSGTSANNVRIWQRLPLHYKKPSSADDLFFRYLIEAYKPLIIPGSSLPKYLHSPTPYGNSRLDQDKEDVEQEPDITQRVSTFIKDCNDNIDFPTRIAMTFVMYVLLRWMIAPSETTYEAVPVWLRPSTVQRTKAHYMWIDFVADAKIRDGLITSSKSNMTYSNFQNYMSHVSVNWADKSTCLLPNSTKLFHAQASDLSELSGKGWDMSSEFLTHILNKENWTITDQQVDAEQMTGVVSSGNLQRDKDLEGLLQGLTSGN